MPLYKALVTGFYIVHFIERRWNDTILVCFAQESFTQLFFNSFHSYYEFTFLRDTKSILSLNVYHNHI